MTELTDPHIVEAVNAAHATRERFGFAPDCPLPRDLLELTEFGFDIPVCVLRLPGPVAGAYQRKRGQSFIFLQAEHYPTRQRFTLAHELGHHVLEHQTRVESTSELDGKTSDPNEQQANYFAGEFLAPLAAAQKWLADNVPADRQFDLKDLVIAADEFRISPPAMLYRLSKGEFDQLTRPHLTILWDQVKEQEHVKLSETLGIFHGDDQLSKIYDAEDWPRVPAKLADNALKAHAVGFINDQRLDEIMRSAA